MADASDADSSNVGEPPVGARLILRWRDGDVPVSERFDDAYFAYQDGRAETCAVFLGGNRLFERFTSAGQFAIGEIGFGTGLNFLETYATWQRLRPAAEARLAYTSFEIAPMARDDMQRALSPWPDLAALARPLAIDWPASGGRVTLALDGCDLTVVIGDARETIRTVEIEADAWYLDGFSPAKNPELWDLELLGPVFERTRPGGTFSTYTAAGWVRRNLQAVGFSVDRVPGFGGKRERLEGSKPLDYTTDATARAAGSSSR